MKKNIKQLIESGKRELKMRKSLYPGLVEQKRMTPMESSHELDCMTEIVRQLKRLYLMEMGMPPGNLVTGEGVISRYTLTWGEHSILLTYVDGVLAAITELREAALLRISEGLSLIFMKIPATVNELMKYQVQGWQIEQIPTLNVDQKIEAFKFAYKNATGRGYPVSLIDRNVIAKAASVEMKGELLELYLSCTDYPLNGPKTLADFCQHYAALPEMYERFRTDADGLPFYFNAKTYAHMEKHQPQLWMKYRKKLKDMGFKEVTTQQGKTWQK